MPNIVKMDANNNYSLLDDPNNIFESDVIVNIMINTQDGKTLFIYCQIPGALYSWDETNYFTLLHQMSNLTGNFAVDSQNNLYSPISGIQIIKGDPFCSFALFNASNEYSGTIFLFCLFSSPGCLFLPFQFTTITFLATVERI